MTDTTNPAHNRRFTNEAANVGTGADATSANFDYGLLEYTDTNGFFDLLREQHFSLGVTREYEHFLLLLDGTRAGPLQSPFPLPHPSGFWFDEDTRELTVSSTRTPNIIVSLTPYTPNELGSSILPMGYQPPGVSDGPIYLPRKSRFLPGSLYIHDVVKMGGKIYATITGHNFLARLDYESGWERVWWPSVVDSLGDDAFKTNFLQLNSIAANKTPEESFYTGFSNITTGAKPWKEGYGPREKGVVFSGKTRSPLATGLTCPHSAKLADGKLWVCNSGYGTFGYIDGFETHDPSKTKYVPVGKAPGFTRGLSFCGDYVFVGLSRVIKAYEPYAPGVDPDSSECGVWVFDRNTGEFVSSLSWTNGYQIYEVQTLPGLKGARLPLASRESDGINPLLRFLG